jgi:hypothetical protein
MIQLRMQGVEGPLQRADGIQILDSIIIIIVIIIIVIIVIVAINYYIQDFVDTKLSLNRIGVYCKLECIS